MKKIFKLLMPLVVVLSAVVMPVSAEDDTMTLQTDTSEDIIINKGETVTLDLNGYTVYGQIVNHGTLTINDSVGTGKVVSTDKPAIVSDDILIINNGTFESSVACIEFTESTKLLKYAEIVNGIFNSGESSEIFDIDESWDFITVHSGNFNKSIMKAEIYHISGFEYNVEGRYIVASAPSLLLENDVTINIGESYSYVVNYNAPYSTPLYWSSSDETVATIDENGKVTGLKDGYTEINVTYSLDGPSYLGATVLLYVGPEEIKEITLSSPVTLLVGESTTLTPMTVPSDAINNTALSWSSSDETIASVDENGLVTALKAGETTITVTTDNQKTATGKVFVNEVVSLTLTEDLNEDFVVGERQVMTLDLNGHTIYGQIVNHGQLTINDSIGTGKVIATGKASVKTFSFLNINGGSYQSDVHCLEYANSQSDFLGSDITNGTFDSGDEYDVVKIDKEVWNGGIFVTGGSFNKSIVKDKIVFYHHDEYLVDGRYIIDRKCDLGLPRPTYSDPTPLQYHVGEIFKLETNPNSQYDLDFVWMSGDESVAKVAQDGTITAVGEGRVSIYAASQNAIMWWEKEYDPFPRFANEGEIEIVATVLEDIQFDETEVIIDADEKYTLVPVTTPSYAINAIELTWISSDDSIATVDENGVVTPLKTGEVEITVSTEDEKSATIKVVVKGHVVETPVIDTTKPVEEPTVGVVDTTTLNTVLVESAKNLFEEELESAISVETELKVEKVKEESVKEDAKVIFALLEQTENKEFSVVQYLDLTIEVTADGTYVGDVTETSTPIEIAVKLPADLLQEGRTFDVVRVHNGEPKYLGATLEGDILTFSTDQFSTYALVYFDEVKKPVLDPNIPNTGDQADTFTYVSLTLVSSITLLGVVISKKRELEN